MHEESTTPSPTTRDKSVLKSSKPMERKEQNAESISTSKQRNDQSQTKERAVIVFRNSIVKHLNGYEISWKLPSKCKVYVHNFPRA